MKEEQQIKNLIKEGESEQLEFLEVVREDSIARNLCAFLNGGGGRVIVGLSDNGKVIGITDAETHKNKLKSYLLNAIVPEAPVTISIETVSQKQLLVLKVWGGSKQPYIFDGNIYYRRNNKTQKATSKEISSLIHGREFAEKHWERQITLGVDLEDLDLKLIGDTIKESQKNDRSSYKGDDVFDFLNHYGLYLNGSFTNACVVLFANNPARFIPQIRVRLTEYAEGKTDNALLRDEVFEGNLFSIRTALEKYVNGLGTRSVFDDKQWKRQDFRFPVKALQEGIINALMHRDYSSFSSGVSIGVYPDRFVITNSGNLPDDIEIKDLKKNHKSHPVNPDIAHIVFLRGLIDKLGRGTLKLIEDCKKAGLRAPIWKESTSDITLTFYGPKNLSERRTKDAANDAVNDAVSDAVTDAVNKAVNDTVNKVVKQRLIDVLRALWVRNRLSLRDLMDLLSVSRATMQRNVLLLIDNGLLKAIGPDKTRKYQLNDALKTKLDAVKSEIDAQ